MAKFGEGDPKWIVAELGETGRNVNNWHWTEKNVIQWTQARIAELVGNLELIQQSNLKVSTQGATATGEAFLTNRKGKVIASYELNVKIPFNVCLADGNKQGQGAIEVPYLAVENYGDKPEIRVTYDPDRDIAHQIYQHGLKEILSGLKTYENEMHTGQNAGSSQSDTTNTKPSAKTPQPPTPTPSAPPPPTAVRTSGNKKQKGRVKMQQTYYAGAKELYECFVDERKATAYCQVPAKIQPKEGGLFSLYGGTVQGSFVKLQPYDLIEQKWRFNSWEEGVFSDVKLQFVEEQKGTTVVKLEQSGLPEEDKFGNHDVLGSVEKGWETQIFRRIRMVFGYGV